MNFFQKYLQAKSTPVKWGILGLGSIANSFAEGLRSVKGAELVACGSRDLKKAQEFAQKWGVASAYGSYEEFAADESIDVVYVATPHPFHRENSILSLNSGKAVLCEKPFTLNAREAAEVIEGARSRKLFLMEAMWTRFLPQMVKVRELIQSGIIGDLRLLQADFGFRGEWKPEGRLLNPQLGGGALLDVGVYPISLAFHLMGQPDRVESHAYLGKSGVDEQASILFGYRDGRSALLSTSIQTTTPQEAVITGSEGSPASSPVVGALSSDVNDQKGG
jgi:predicted dehydrogenase